MVLIATTCTPEIRELQNKSCISALKMNVISCRSRELMDHRHLLQNLPPISPIKGRVELGSYDSAVRERDAHDQRAQLSIALALARKLGLESGVEIVRGRRLQPYRQAHLHTTIQQI